MKADLAFDARRQRDRLVPDVDANRAMDATTTDHLALDLPAQGTFGYRLRIKPDRRVGGGNYAGIDRRQRL